MAAATLFPSEAPTISLRPYQTEGVEAVIEAWKKPPHKALMVLPTGCHRAGQGILMYDGSVMPVEQIVEGELLMGPDSQPRKVLALVRGQDEMYEVHPVKGNPWVVNKEHILSLMQTNTTRAERAMYPSQKNGGVIRDVSVADWLGWAKHRKHIHKLFRVGVDFHTASWLPVHPYLLGVLLGDGGLSIDERVHITNVDAPVIQEVERIVGGLDLHLRLIDQPDRTPDYAIVGGIGKKKQPLRYALHQLGLLPIRCENRFIPHIYRTASRKDRLELLAGLIDTDGSHWDSMFEFSSKSRQLAEDVMFVARSLGLAAYSSPKLVNGVTYYRVDISGDCSIVPTRIPRKQALPRQQKKDVLRTGFTCVPTGTIEEYYGFTLDGDQRYLLDDFTVTHNCGKTIVFSALAQRCGVPTLILAHREELLLQAKEKMRLVWPEADIGIVAGKLNLEEWGHQITIAGVQTVVKPHRMGLLHAELGSGGICIVDEAHHAQAQTYRTILEALSNVCLLGVTATVDRADGKDILELFGPVVYERGLLWAIENDYLVDLRGIQVSTSVSLEGVKTRMGDFAEDELERRVNKPERNEIVVAAYKKHAEGRQAICFSVTVQHARDLAETFRAAGVKAQVVWGEMAGHLRRQTLYEYQRGDLQVLVNCGVLTEGFDAPETSCIILARPTKSRPLYCQMIGRGTRLAPAKEDCLILDIADNAGRHSLTTQNLPRLAGGDYGRELPDEDGATRRVNQGVSLRAVQYKEAGKVVEREIALLPKWEKAPAGRFKLQLQGKADLWIAPRGDNRYIVGIVWPDGRKQQVGQEMALDWAQSVADEKARTIQTGGAKLIDKDAAWRQGPASEKQIGLLNRFHVKYQPGITKGEASDALDKIFDRMRQKQTQKGA